MNLNEGDKVELLIRKRTDLGFVVIINNEYEGLLFHSDVFRPLDEGDETEGYIKKIREDGLIDVSLKPQGFKNVIELNAKDILTMLREQNGFLPLHDKSPPEMIERHLHMSKKAFKAATGFLYKQRKIRIEDNGIYLA